MGRAKTILQSDYPYNISSRCINKEWFTLPMDQVWDIFCEELFLTNLYYGLNIHSFVLMSNHFHLIASTPNANIDKCMWYFISHVSRRLTLAGNRINGTFAGRYYKTILNSYSYYLNAYKYNYRNPLTIEGQDLVEDYPYSTLAGLLGKCRISTKS